MSTNEITLNQMLIAGVRPPLLEARRTPFWDEHLYLPVLRWSRVALDSFQEWPTRPRCGHFFGGSYWYGLETAQTLFALAVLARVGPYNSQVNGVSHEELTERTVAGIRYLGFTHDTGPADCVRAKGPNPHASERKWGGAGDGFFQASQHGVPVAHFAGAAWLLWEQLDDETRQLVINVLESYADRWCDELPRSGVYLDTQTEENGWTGHCVGLAAVMLRHHPRAGQWAEGAARWIANICATPYDRAGNTAPLQGKRVADWISTVTTHPDFTGENHGFVHPNYMASGLHFAGIYALFHGMAGLPTPEVARFNRQPLYDVLKCWTETDGIQTPVQGQDWWYTNHYACILPHAVMSTLFGDRDAALLERRCAQTASTNAASVGGGHFFAPDPERLRLNEYQSMRTAERGAASALTKAYLLHQVFGDGAEPAAPEEFEARHCGVHRFPHGGLVVRRGRDTTAIFSWRNRPVVLVQPAEGCWTITPHAFSLTGSFETEPATGIAFRALWQRTAELPDGFAATAALERAEGALMQRVALVVPADDIAFFFEQTRAERAVRLSCQRAGEVSVRNEEYAHLGEWARGRRVLYTEGQQFEAVSRFGGEDEWFHAPPAANWANVDDRIGYVVFGGAGIAYQCRHHYPRYRGLEDFLILSYANAPRALAAGETASRLAVAIRPNADHAATRSFAAAVRRPDAAPEMDALLTPEWLAAVNFADRAQTLTLALPLADAESLPVFAARLSVTAGVARYEVPVPAGSAVALPRLAEVTPEEGLVAWGTPTGEVFVSSPGQAAAQRL